jgi:hypothetical protein
MDIYQYKQADNMRPLQNGTFYPISASPMSGIYASLRQAQISILEIFYIFLPAPWVWQIVLGWLKFSPSFNSNKNYHFSKVFFSS